MSKRSSSLCTRFPKHFSESKAQLSRLLLSSSYSQNSLTSLTSTCKSNYETPKGSCEDLMGSSMLLAREVDRLSLLNSTLYKEIEHWKRKYKDSNRLLDQKRPTEIDGVDEGKYKQKYTNLKHKVGELKERFKSLEGVIQEKNQEIGLWKEKYVQMEHEYVEQIRTLKAKTEMIVKTQIEKHVNMAFSQHEKEKAALEESWNASIAKLNQIQNELKMSNDERDKALGQLSQTRERLSVAEVNCHSIQSKYAVMNEELERIRKMIQEQSLQQDEAQKRLLSMKEEKERALRQVETTKDKLVTAEKNYKDAQGRYTLLNSEAERTRSLAEEKDKRIYRLEEELAATNEEKNKALDQLEQTKVELMLAEEKNIRMDTIQEELKFLNEEQENKLKQLEQAQRQLVTAEKNYQEVQKKYSVLNGEVQRLNGLLREKNMSLGKLQEELKTVTEERDSAVKELEGIRGELLAAERKSHRHAQLQEDGDRAVAQIQELRRQLELVENCHLEAQKQNGLLSVEIERLREMGKEGNVRMNELSEEVRCSREEKDRMLRELEEINEKLGVAQGHQQDAKNKLSLQKVEIERLQIISEEKTVLLEKMQEGHRESNLERDRISEELERARQQLCALEKSHQEVLGNQNLLDSEIKNLWSMVESKNEEINRLQGVEQEHRTQIMRLQEELEAMVLGRNEALKSLEIARQQLSSLEGNHVDTTNNLAMLNAEVQRLQAIGEEKANKIAELQEQLRCSDEERERALREGEEVKGQLSSVEVKHQESIVKAERLCLIVNDLKEKLQSSSQGFSKASKELEVTREQLSAVEKENKEIQDNCAFLKMEIENLQRLIEERSTELNEAKTALKIKEKEAEMKESELNVYIKRLEAQNEEVERLAQNVKELDSELTQVRKGPVRKNQECQWGAHSLEQQTDEEKALSYLEQVHKLEQIIEGMKGDIVKLRVEGIEKERLSDEVSELKLVINAYKEEKKALLKENITLSCMKDRVEEYEEGIKVLRKERNELRAKLEAVERECEEARTQYGRKEQEVGAIQKVKVQIEEGYEERIRILSEKIGMLGAQNGELQGQIEGLLGKAKENEELQKKMQEICERLKMYAKEDKDIEAALNKVMETGIKVNKLDGEVQLWKKLFEQDRERNSIEKKEMSKQIQELSEMWLSVTRIVGEDLSTEMVLQSIETDKMAVKKLGEEMCLLKIKAQESQRKIGYENEELVGKLAMLEGKLKESNNGWEQLKIILEDSVEMEGIVRKVGEQKGEIKKLGAEIAAWKSKYEDQEMRNIQEIHRLRSEIEAAWKKRMETEVESRNLCIKEKEEEMLKVQVYIKKAEEAIVEKKALADKNEKLMGKIKELTQEIKEVTAKIEGGSSASGVEVQWKEKASFLEEQARVLKTQVEDFEMRQVMYFIEIERLYSINGKLVEDYNKVAQELKECSEELERNKKLVKELSGKHLVEKYQQFGSAISDIRNQIDGFEKMQQGQFREGLTVATDFSSMRIQNLNSPMMTPTSVSSMKERASTVDRMPKKRKIESIERSHAELKDLTVKFETEKKTMETQLVQLRKLVDMNKFEMRKLNEDNGQFRIGNENLLTETSWEVILTSRFPSATKPMLMIEQPQQAAYEPDDIKPRSPFRPKPQYSPLVSASGKENSARETFVPGKNNAHPILGFRNPLFQRHEDVVYTKEIFPFKN